MVIFDQMAILAHVWNTSVFSRSDTKLWQLALLWRSDYPHFGVLTTPKKFGAVSVQSYDRCTFSVLWPFPLHACKKVILGLTELTGFGASTMPKLGTKNDRKMPRSQEANPFAFTIYGIFINKFFFTIWEIWELKNKTTKKVQCWKLPGKNTSHKYLCILFKLSIFALCFSWTFQKCQICESGIDKCQLAALLG